MDNQEAVEPVPQMQEITADRDKIIAVLRQENEELRHRLRIMSIAWQDATNLARELRTEVDAIALQMAANEEGKKNGKKFAASKNGAKQ